jgi:hypothetical protein
MTSPSFFEEGSKLLPPGAFEVVLEGELRRAVRSQSFLTLVVVETRCEWAGTMVAADDGIVLKIAQIIGKEVRDTDLLGRPKRGSLALLLIDANLDDSAGVIDRLVSRIGSHEFPTVMRIAMGAACCPTHAVDAATLKHRAVSHATVNWRTPVRASADPN